MIGDAFVFDCVAHVFNFDSKNAFGTPGEMFSNHLYAFHAALTPAGQTVLPASCSRLDPSAGKSSPDAGFAGQSERVMTPPVGRET
ncbi:hypothetical protein BH24ACT26_BH24ACT26_00100 [soil metagenome]